MKPTNDVLVKAPLTGFADAKLKEAETLDTVFSYLVPEYNIERFEAVAVRIYLATETVITLYAIEKERSTKRDKNDEKLPVKKFKLNITLDEFLQYFSNINMTISKDNFDIKDIEVINV